MPARRAAPEGAARPSDGARPPGAASVADQAMGAAGENEAVRQYPQWLRRV